MEMPSFEPPAHLPSFFLFFLSAYLIGYLLIFPKWGPMRRSQASCCLMSLFHGAPSVLMASHVLTSLPRAPAPFASPNTAAETTVLDFSLAYFLMDLLHYLLFFPSDLLFILHHVATVYVLATCRFAVGHGAHGLLVLLVLAEVTSPCQNVWSIAGYRRDDSLLAKKVRGFLSPPFFALYTVVRGILGPLVLYEMAEFYVSGAAEGVVPRWAWSSWLAVIGVAIPVSVLWVLGHWKAWFRERNFKKER